MHLPKARPRHRTRLSAYTRKLRHRYTMPAERYTRLMRARGNSSIYPFGPEFSALRAQSAHPSQFSRFVLTLKTIKRI